MSGLSIDSGRVWNGARAGGRFMWAFAKSLPRVTLAVLKSLGCLALLLLVAAFGAGLIWEASQTLLSDDAGILRGIAEHPSLPPLPPTVGQERSQSLVVFGFGMFVALLSFGGLVYWWQEVWNSLFVREQPETSKESRNSSDGRGM